MAEYTPNGFKITKNGNTYIFDLPTKAEVNQKADKIDDAITGNLVKTDTYGNIQDSGYSAEDFIPIETKGEANGVAELDSYGKVPASQLPSYVNDVLEYDAINFSDWNAWVSGNSYEVGDRVKAVVDDEVVGYICTVANSSAIILSSEWRPATRFPDEGESGVIYIATDTNVTYRWSGSTYTPIRGDLALGETSSTAYRGDRGAAAYAAAVTNAENIPTENSENLIKSGAVYAGLDEKAPKANPVFTGSISMGRGESSTVGANSTAVGNSVVASGPQSHAEGASTIASGDQSHAEGNSTRATGTWAHAEGYDGQASGAAAHSEGNETSASGASSHAEGEDTFAIGNWAHAEGGGTTASGDYSHAEGSGTTASGTYSHSEGGGTRASATGSHAEGAGTTASGANSHAEGAGTTASGGLSHAEGSGTTASGGTAHAEGNSTTASEAYSHAEGCYTKASGLQSHAEGYGSTYIVNGVQYTSEAKGPADHTEGYQCLTANTQPGNHAEGYQTQATGGAAHSEGNRTIASGSQSHAEGEYTIASGAQSHAEGTNTTASGNCSHAEGRETIASGYGAHAEGTITIASGAYSHVSGAGNVADSYDNWSEWVANTSYEVGDKVKRTTTSNNATTVKGYICNTANSDSSFTASKWNDQNGRMNYAEIIGNGSNTNARSNARALDWNGNEYLMGDVYVGCSVNSTGGSKLIASSQKGIANGVAELDANGKVPSSQLPSYVDDVLEYDSLSAFPATGEDGKIYIAKDTNITYRWGGSEYVPIGSDLALGETSSTAYRGDRGAAAYAAAVTNVETTPSSGSSNLITSGAVYTGLDGKAPKANPVFTGSLSLGRSMAGTTGNNSTAFGSSVTASGNYSHAEGSSTTASGVSSHAEGSTSKATAYASHAEGSSNAYGDYSHSEGAGTARGDHSHAEGSGTAKGNRSHAEGSSTNANGLYSHAEGDNTTADGRNSHVEGYYTVAKGTYSHVSGKYNVLDNYDNWDEWVANTSYEVGDKVKRTISEGLIIQGFICKVANNDSEFTSSNWDFQNDQMNYAEIVGNGHDSNNLSNARALDWDGNEYLKGDVYVNCDASSRNGSKLAKVSELPSAMTGADGTNAGVSGLVPAPAATDNEKFLRGDGTWQSSGKPMVILSYGDSVWNDFLDAYNSNVIVYCRASSNSDPATGSQTRMAFMAYVNNSTNPTEVEFQYYRSVSSHSATQQGDQVFVYKLNKTAGWTVTTREASTKMVAGTGLSSSYSNGVLTLNSNVPAAPSSDGTYFLQCVVANGTPTYSWVSVPAANGVSF